MGTSPLFNTQCPSFALFQCSLISPLFLFAYSGSGVALFTPFIRSLLLTIFVSVLDHVRCSTWAQSESGDREKRSNVTKKKCSNVTKKSAVTWLGISSPGFFWILTKPLKISFQSYWLTVISFWRPFVNQFLLTSIPVYLICFYICIVSCDVLM